ncbi:MAG: vWA domain-containing protein [Anaerolineae bacterium]
MNSNNNTGSLTLEVRLDRPVITVDGGTCFVWIRVRAPGAAHNPTRQPLNVAFVLDRSGSMSGAKLAYVKQAAQYALGLLDSRDRAALVMYDDEVSVLSPSLPMSDPNRELLRKLIQPIETGGSTNMGGGWLTGCDQVASFLQAGVLNRALLLTDGLANVGIVDREQLAQHAKELRLRGISTTTLGVGADFDEHMLTALANAGGGHYYFIENPNDIPRIFHSELAEMQAVVASDVRLTLDMPTNSRFVLLNDTYENSQQGNQLVIQLNELAGSEEREFLLKVDLAPMALGATATLQPSLIYTAPGSGQAASMVGDAVYITAVSPQQYQDQPADVSIQDKAALHEAARAKLQASQAIKDGNYAQAKEILKQSHPILAGLAASPEAREQAAQIDQYDADYLLMSPLQRKMEQSTNYRTNRSRR